MDAQAIAALVQLGVAGVFLYAFLSDRLRTKASVDERVDEHDELWRRAYDEMKAERDEWRRLALGTERRLDAALPTVATAIGAPVPSVQAHPLERGT